MTGEGAETIMMTGGGRMTSRTEEDPAVTEKTGEEEVTETTLIEESLQVEDTLHPPHPMAGDTEHDPGAKNVFIKITCIFCNFVNKCLFVRNS